MSIVRRLARPLLAASFVRDGLDAVMHPLPRAEGLEPLVTALAAPLGVRPDPETFVRANGAVMAAAGMLLGGGRLPRLAATALVLTALPTTYSEGAFWTEKDPELRRAHRRRLLAQLGLVAGALLAAVDTDGRPGLVWRGRHAGHHAKVAARAAKDRTG